ncbi:RimK family alpha-L-glutamate ligase [Aliikangiella sp. IMCC44653]
MGSVEGKIVVGSEEWCAFPQLGIPAIKARVDSGAKTSSLHAFNIQTLKRKGELWVSFEVHPLQQHRYPIIRCEAKVVDKRSVKSSSGVAEKRYVIKTELQSGDEHWEIEVTLTNRDSMGYRMLLGRQAMNGRMLVDPSASFRLGQRSAAQLKKHYPVSNSEASDGIKIGLLATNPELYSNKRLMEAAMERGHQVEFLNIKQCNLRLDNESSEIHSRSGQIINHLDAVIPRIRTSFTTYGCALTRQFEIMGVTTLNSAESIKNSRDNIFSLQTFFKNGIKTPTSVCSYSPFETNDLIDMVGGAPLMVKLLDNQQQHKAVMAESRDAGQSVIEAFKHFREKILVQEFLKDAEGKALRCLVINGKVVASIWRKPIPGSFKTSIKDGASAELAKITPNERKMALLAAKVLHLKVAGVDMVRTKSGPVLLQVTSTPGLEGAENATGKDIAGMVIAAIEKKMGWKRELAKI